MLSSCGPHATASRSTGRKGRDARIVPGGDLQSKPNPGLAVPQRGGQSRHRACRWYLGIAGDSQPPAATPHAMIIRGMDHRYRRLLFPGRPMIISYVCWSANGPGSLSTRYCHRSSSIFERTADDALLLSGSPRGLVGRQSFNADTSRCRPVSPNCWSPGRSSTGHDPLLCFRRQPRHERQVAAETASAAAGGPHRHTITPPGWNRSAPRRSSRTAMSWSARCDDSRPPAG